MKIENLLTAQRLASQLKDLNRALEELNKTDKFTKDSCGWEAAGTTGLYQFHLNEFGDGSGFNVDLTGLQVGTKILKYAKQLLEEKREDIHRQIAEL